MQKRIALFRSFKTMEKLEVCRVGPKKLKLVKRATSNLRGRNDTTLRGRNDTLRGRRDKVMGRTPHGHREDRQGCREGITRA